MRGDDVMTRDEALALIQETLEQQRVEHFQHLQTRHKVERFQLPDGKTFISTTIERMELLRKFLLLIAFFLGVVWAGIWGYYDYVVFPRTRVIVQQMIDTHEERETERMRVVTSGYVSHPEMDAWKADKERRWVEQDKFNERIEQALIDMQKDIKELLRRVR